MLSSAAPLIECVDLGKSFQRAGGAEVKVLQGISLQIQAGEFVAIMGASGSGKSTLMAILGCLDVPSSGVYKFNGQDIAQLSADQLAFLRRECFGFIFQGYHLIATATAVQNVELPSIYAGKSSMQRREQAAALLSQLGLGQRLDHRPHQLSGGQQQRVAIARALMNGGQIILADEPTGALDSHSGAEVMRLLSDLSAAGHTVILITHDAVIAAQAARIITLKDGHIISDVLNSAQNYLAEQSKRLVAKLPVCTQPLSGWQTFAIALKLALPALRVNGFRTLLTLLGIVIGVSSVVAMLAIGEGAKQDVMTSIQQMGSHLLLLRPGQPGTHGASDSSATLVPEDADALADIPDLVAAVPEVSGSATVRFGNIDTRTSVTATGASYPLVRDWPLAQGVFFTLEDEQRYATVAVLGKTVVDQLFAKNEQPLGQYVFLNNIPFQVIGLLSAKGATPWGQDADDVIMVPLSTGSLRLFGQRYLRSITIAVARDDAMDAVQNQVQQRMLARHGKEDFQVRNMAAIVETATQTQDTLTWMLGSVAAISLLVGGIGVMNIMLVTVTERTREIGIRLANGARKRDILWQFLIEAVVISTLGGFVGVILGVVVGLLAQGLGLSIQFSLLTALLAFSCSVLTGLIFGFTPAYQAARLHPVAALSSE